MDFNLKGAENKVETLETEVVEKNNKIVEL